MLLSAYLLSITSLLIDNCSLMALSLQAGQSAAVLRDDTARWFFIFLISTWFSFSSLLQRSSTFVNAGNPFLSDLVTDYGAFMFP